MNIKYHKFLGKDKYLVFQIYFFNLCGKKRGNIYLFKDKCLVPELDRNPKTR